MTRPSAARFVAVLLAVGIATVAFVLVPPHPSATALPGAYVSPTTLAVGETYTVSGEGCINPTRAPSELPPRVDVRGPGFVGVLWAEDDGSWSFDTTAEHGGTFTVTSTCALPSGTVSYAPVTFTVVGPPAPPTPTPWWQVTPAPGGHTPDVAPSPPAARPTMPRATAASSAASTAGSSAPPAAPTSAPPAPATASAVFVAAPGCVDCERLTGREPLTAGAELTLSYSGFQPGEQVTVVMRSTPVELGVFPADATGVVTAVVTIPISAEADSHTLTLSGPATGDQILRFRLAAGEEPAGEPVTAPASEGTDLTLPILVGAAVLLLAGGGVLLYRRRAARPGSPQEAGTPGQPTETPIAEPIA